LTKKSKKDLRISFPVIRLSIFFYGTVQQFRNCFAAIAPILQKRSSALDHFRIVKITFVISFLQKFPRVLCLIYLAKGFPNNFPRHRLINTFRPQFLLDFFWAIAAFLSSCKRPITRKGLIINVMQRTESFQRLSDDSAGIAATD